LRLNIRAKLSALALSVFVALLAGAISSQAQTFKVLHEFNGAADGAQPGGLTLGRAGEVYGVANGGGKSSGDCSGGCGTIFELFRVGPDWQFTLLHTFQDGPDGAFPFAPMVYGPDGRLYGTTGGGGMAASNDSPSSGTVFRLQPPTVPCGKAHCPWREKVVYRFKGGSGGGLPGFDAPLSFDDLGNIYGTTQLGGYMVGICADNYGCGVVFALMPSNGSWVENVLHAFGFSGDPGVWPTAGVIFDKHGNLYGTTTASTVFQLARSDSGWKYNTLLETADTITAGLIFDRSGNLYGATSDGGPSYGGSAFKMKPENGSWEVQAIYSFGNTGDSYYPGPGATLTMDRAGNLYGTTSADGLYGLGTVFKLSPTGAWTYNYTDLHDFTGGSDGQSPSARLVLDDDGNLYGTTFRGGDDSKCQNGGCGVVFEIMP
jgi:uncharacterized repeat protein (TIGR03803 family)